MQKNFDDALVRLDSLTGTNNRLQSQLTGANSDIAKKKAEIRSILGKRNATAAELNRAKSLINELNGKITDLEKQVADLTTQNTQLTADKTQLTADKEKLTSDLQTTNTAKGRSGKESRHRFYPECFQYCHHSGSRQEER